MYIANSGYGSTANEQTGGENGSGGNTLGGETVVIKNKPKLIISNYKLNPEMPKAGEAFTIDLTFYNTNGEKAVRNIKISLNGAEASTGANGQPTGGSVFSPVNSSNTFYIPEIYAGDTASKEITLKVVPNAQAQNYAITVNFEYEDRQGNEFTASEIIGIPVVQQAKILYGDVAVAESFVGSPTTVGLDFYNTGKDSLTTFMVSVEGDGFQVVDSPRYFVGNFAPGASDHYSVDIIPMQAGPVEGRLLVSYEDSTGKQHTDEQKFQFEATEMAFDESEIQVDPETGFVIDPVSGKPIDPTTGQPVDQNNLLTNPLLWVGIAVVVLVVTLLLRRRSKKKNEEDLTIDA